MSDPGYRQVIRRKKIVTAHHGGSWKIAFADFMTALMALFLVLWLLSSATQAELDAMEEYFSTPLRVALAGGDRSAASSNVIPGGGPDPAFSAGEQARIYTHPFNRPADVQRHFNELRRQINSRILDDPQLRQLQHQLRIYDVPEGLLIQVLDSDNRPMFQLGSDKVEPYMRRLLHTLAPLLNQHPNRISISGHTDAYAYRGSIEGYSNWELSTDRANASRRELMAGGLAPEKLLRIVGMADQVTMQGTEPTDAVNRRIELIVLDESGLPNAGVERLSSIFELPFTPI